MLLLDPLELVVRQGGTTPLEKAFHLCVVNHAECGIYLKLNGGHQLDFTVSLGRLVQGAVLVLKIEVLAAEDSLEQLDQRGLPRVGHTVDPDYVLLRVLPLKEDAV